MLVQSPNQMTDEIPNETFGEKCNVSPPKLIRLISFVSRALLAGKTYVEVLSLEAVMIHSVAFSYLP